MCRYRLQCKDNNCGQQPGGTTDVGYSGTGEVRHQQMKTRKLGKIKSRGLKTQHFLFLSTSSLTSRYRSITKQFFRKADGVVVMYDITAEPSFTAVRQWLTSVKVRVTVALCCTRFSQNYHTQDKRV